VPGAGAVRLCADRDGTTVYGLSAGSGDLWRLEPDGAVLTSLGRAPGEKPSPVIICDDRGNLFGASDWGRLFRWEAATGGAEHLDLYLPHMAYRRFLAGWSAAVRLPDGTILGGTAGDGLLFRLDPAALVLRRLGKPARQDHIAGLAVGSDGTVWGIAGERDDICHVFSHNPATGESADEGAVGWRVPTLAILGEALVMGEARAVSRLVVLRRAKGG
jgi:streptogramin lyase